jgi:hypothetical protein
MNEKLKAAKEAAEKRTEEANAARDAVELEALELEAKLSDDGKIANRDFVVVRTTRGPLGLVRGDSVLAKKLQIALVKAKTPDEEHGLMYDFVIEQCVSPQREAAQKLLGDYRFLVDKCSNLLASLHRGEDLSQQGKS